jgi:hypothetical protein
MFPLLFSLPHLPTFHTFHNFHTLFCPFTMIGLLVDIALPRKGSQAHRMPPSDYLMSEGLRSSLKCKAGVSDSELSPKKLVKASIMPPHIESDNTMDDYLERTGSQDDIVKVYLPMDTTWPSIVQQGKVS